MTEYITKEQTIELLHYNNDEKCAAIIADVEELEPADVAPVMHATTSKEYWDEAYCTWKTCDNCKGGNQSAAKYCNWCGARLDGDCND